MISLTIHESETISCRTVPGTAPVALPGYPGENMKSSKSSVDEMEYPLVMTNIAIENGP